MAEPITYTPPRLRISVLDAGELFRSLDLFLADIRGDPAAVQFHDLRTVGAAEALVAKIKERILPFLEDRPPAKVEPQIVAEPKPAIATPPPQPHSFWVAITRDRHGGYHVDIRLFARSNTPVMQSRRQDKPSEARREARRIFGDHLDWMTGDQAGLHTQPWVIEIAEVKL